MPKLIAITCCLFVCSPSYSMSVCLFAIGAHLVLVGFTKVVRSATSLVAAIAAVAATVADAGSAVEGWEVWSLSVDFGSDVDDKKGQPVDALAVVTGRLTDSTSGGWTCGRCGTWEGGCKLKNKLMTKPPFMLTNTVKVSRAQKTVSCFYEAKQAVNNNPKIPILTLYDFCTTKCQYKTVQKHPPIHLKW